MSRKFISSIVAAAIALTSVSAVPAAADNRNLERFIIGAGTILLLNELSDYKVEANHKKNGKSYGKSYNKGYGKKHGKKQGKSYGKKRLAPLPGYCLTRIQTRHGSERLFSARCLYNSYRHAQYLPRSCKVTVKTWRRGHRVTRTGYKPRCLRSKGFHIA